MSPYRAAPRVKLSLWCWLGFHRWDTRQPLYHSWRLFCGREGCIATKVIED